MTRINYLITIVIFYLSLIGCSRSKENLHNNLPDIMYQTAQKKIYDGKWKEAIRYLKSLDDNHLLSQNAQQVQLDLINAYYKDNNMPMAQLVINKFMRLNPGHHNIDYVIYMRGLTSMALDNNVLQAFFKIDRSNCNPKHALNAFNDFSSLINDYPSSQYVSDAIKHLVCLKNRLARYEYLVAEYYSSRGAWIAVINRVEGILRNYPGTQVTRDSLKLMENAYRQMHMDFQADKISKIITANDTQTLFKGKDIIMR